MTRRQRAAAAALLACLAVTACTGGSEDAGSSEPAATGSPATDGPTSPDDPAASPTTDGDRTDEGTAAGASTGGGTDDDATTAGEQPAVLDLGDELAPADVAPGAPGMAWQVDGAVLLTTTSGTPIGHLPGWTLDRDLSDRHAAPVLRDPDGEAHAVTLDGLVPTAGPIPLVDGSTLELTPSEVAVIDPSGEVLTTIATTGDGELWVSATGSVVTVEGRDAWDVEAVAPLEVEAGCHVADRHTADAPLLVCDDGARLAGGTDVTAPEGTRFGWVTVGTTGDEVIASTRPLDGDGSTGLVLVARGAGEVTELAAPGPDGGGALFYRSGGNAWVAGYGAGGGLDVLTPSGALERVRDLPGVTDAMIWTR